jgi:peptide deformylase
MVEIIKDIEKLTSVAKPLQFLTEQGIEKEEGLEIIGKIKEAMEADSAILALAAPQIGIDSRIFCIRFNDQIKTFINPIITKKA